MMPVIRLNDATFADLSVLKTWFGTKTPSETIDRIVRDAMEQHGMERDGPDEDATALSVHASHETNSVPGLAFTKPVVATIDGQVIHNPKWSTLLRATIHQVKLKGFEGRDLVRELQVQATETEYNLEGYRYHSDLGISVQGQSATEAWKEIDRLATKHAIPVFVRFRWQDDPKAQHPGLESTLQAGPR